VTAPGKLDRIIAAALFAGTLAVTVVASRRQGIVRDEAYYMEAGEQYVTYWERTLTGSLERPLSDASIRSYWEYNHEHPPLMKLLYGLSWRMFHRCQCAAERAWHPTITQLPSGRHVTLPLFARESTAFRLPTMLCFALLAALVYRFFVEALGSGPPLAARAGGIAAAVLAVAQPRAFFHAQTAGFDLPVAVFWFALTYLYWRALLLARGRVRGAIVVGLVYGLFLATKLQSFFLPLALGAHWLVLRAGVGREPERRPNPWLLPAMVVLGPLVFLLSWPWLWHETIPRLGAYLGFHLHHVHYNFEYLGRNYNHPPYPWHEPLGMLATTAPVVLLALAAAGIVILARRRRPRDPRGTRLLLLLAGAVPVAPFFLGSTPIFGETKHWLATMPILALCAGVAVQAIGAALLAEWNLGEARPGAARAALAALVLAAVVPAAVETARSHPYGLSHYNALAGGAPGGADLGMNRQFWGYSVAGLLPWLDAELPPDTRLYLHDWNHDAYTMYLRDGRLRPDILDAGMEDPGVRASNAALVIHEKHFAKYEYMIWDAYRTVRPAQVLTLDGVPLVTVYTRP
jgi:hypothetical protein